MRKAVPHPEPFAVWEARQILLTLGIESNGDLDVERLALRRASTFIVLLRDYVQKQKSRRC